MDLTLSLRMQFSGENPEWWKDPEVVRRLARAFEDAGVWFDFGWVGKMGVRRLQRLASPAVLANIASSWQPNGEYVIHRRREYSSLITNLQIEPDPGRLNLLLGIAAQDVEPRRATILDQLIDATVRIRTELLPGGVRFGRACSVHSGNPYPEPRPPRTPRGWEAGSLVDFVDRASYVEAIGEERAADELERILASPLPIGTTLQEHGPLIVFRHVRDVTDEEAVRQARRAQATWITSHVPSDRAPFFNELGDEVIVALSAPHPLLTAYEHLTAEGYKAVMHVEGEPEPAELKELSAWVRAGRLPDGTPLKRLTILLSTRSSAISLAQRARELALHVAYVSATGGWWAPNLEWSGAANGRVD